MELEKCAEYAVGCILGSNEVLAWLSWISSIIGLGGLLIAIVQIAGLKSSAQKVEAALSKVSTHVDSVNLSNVSAQLDTVNHYIHSAQLPLASALYSPVKRSLRMYVATLALEDAELSMIKRKIAAVRKQLEWGASGDGRYKSHIAQGNIDELLALIAQWESDLAAKNRTEITNANA